MLWAFRGDGGQGRLGVRGGLPGELSSLWSEQVEFRELGDRGEGMAGGMIILTRARDSCSRPSPLRCPDLGRALWMEA